MPLFVLHAFPLLNYTAEAPLQGGDLGVFRGFCKLRKVRCLCSSPVLLLLPLQLLGAS